MITSLACKEGYCFATNNYCAEELGVNRKTVSSWITHLEEKKFIIRYVIRNENQRILKRKIYLNDVPSNVNIIEVSYINDLYDYDNKIVDIKKFKFGDKFRFLKYRLNLKKHIGENIICKAFYLGMPYDIQGELQFN